MLLRTLLVIGLAAQSAQTVVLKPRFAVGDQFRLEITRTREDSARPQASITNSTLVDVRVLTTTDTGSELLWRPVPSTGNDAGGDPTLAMANRAISGLDFRLGLDADGALQNVLNESELVPKFTAAVETVIAQAEKQTAADQVARMRQTLQQILTPALLMSLATRDAQLYLSMAGTEVIAGKTRAIPLKQPNPFGGQPLPAVLQLALTSTTADTITMTSQLVYDADALKQTALELFSKSAKPIPTDEAAGVQLQISDDGTYVFDRTLSLFREVTNTRRVSAGAGGSATTRVDRTAITLVAPPKR